MPFDLSRLRELRAFLIGKRAQLQPADVGLPTTARRRVLGLRREEVAELLGVSAIWYRWFESGRDVRVSESFLSRLSKVLRLDAIGEVTLYRLALPGLYRADRSLREQGTPGTPDVSFGSASEIELTARDFTLAREAFLNESRVLPDVTRPRVARSWTRSQSLGVDAERNVASLSVERDDDLRERLAVNARLLRASTRATADLTSRLAAAGHAVVVTDAHGCLLRISGNAQMRQQLSRLGFEPGGDWSENSAGTNAIGTAIADGRSFQLMGAEHYCNGWLGLTCTAAPIRDAATDEIVGVLDVTADYRQIRPQLLGLVTDYAMEIEQTLATTGPRAGKLGS
jgi:transcriptional regulator with XRE-family HTH domain